MRERWDLCIIVAFLILRFTVNMLTTADGDIALINSV